MSRRVKENPHTITYDQRIDKWIRNDCLQRKQYIKAISTVKAVENNDVVDGFEPIESIEFGQLQPPYPFFHCIIDLKENENVEKIEDEYFNQMKPEYSSFISMQQNF